MDENVLTKKILQTELLKIAPRKRDQEQIQQLEKLIETFHFFQEFPEIHKKQIINQCAKQLRYQVSKQSSSVVTIGDTADKFYIILKGSVGVYIPKKEQDDGDNNSKNKGKQKNNTKSSKHKDLTLAISLGSGYGFGEVGLLFNTLRTATIKVHSPEVHLAVLYKSDFDLILKETELKKMNTGKKFLAQLDIFRDLSLQELQDVYLSCELIMVQRNDIVFKESDLPYYCFIIKEGEMSLYKDVENPKYYNQQNQSKYSDFQGLNGFNRCNRYITKKITQLHGGQIFGEEDLVYSQKRQFSIICDSDEAEMYRIPYKLFHRKVYPIKEIKERINHGILQKQKNLQERMLQIESSMKDFSSFLVTDRKSPSNLDKICQKNEVKVIRETNILSQLRQIQKQSQNQKNQDFQFSSRQSLNLAQEQNRSSQIMNIVSEFQQLQSIQNQFDEQAFQNIGIDSNRSHYQQLQQQQQKMFQEKKTGNSEKNIEEQEQSPQIQQYKGDYIKSLNQNSEGKQYYIPDYQKQEGYFELAPDILRRKSKKQKLKNSLQNNNSQQKLASENLNSEQNLGCNLDEKEQNNNGNNGNTQIFNELCEKITFQQSNTKIDYLQELKLDSKNSTKSNFSKSQNQLLQKSGILQTSQIYSPSQSIYLSPKSIDFDKNFRFFQQQQQGNNNINSGLQQQQQQMSQILQQSPKFSSTMQQSKGQFQIDNINNFDLYSQQLSLERHRKNSFTVKSQRLLDHKQQVSSILTPFENSRRNSQIQQLQQQKMEDNLQQEDGGQQQGYKKVPLEVRQYQAEGGENIDWFYKKILKSSQQQQKQQKQRKFFISQKGSNQNSLEKKEKVKNIEIPEFQMDKFQSISPIKSSNITSAHSTQQNYFSSLKLQSAQGGQKNFNFDQNSPMFMDEVFTPKVNSQGFSTSNQMYFKNNINNKGRRQLSQRNIKFPSQLQKNYTEKDAPLQLNRVKSSQNTLSYKEQLKNEQIKIQKSQNQWKNLIRAREKPKSFSGVNNINDNDEGGKVFLDSVLSQQKQQIQKSQNQHQIKKLMQDLSPDKMEDFSARNSKYISKHFSPAQINKIKQEIKLQKF